VPHQPLQFLLKTFRPGLITELPKYKIKRECLKSFSFALNSNNYLLKSEHAISLPYDKLTISSYWHQTFLGKSRYFKHKGSSLSFWRSLFEGLFLKVVHVILKHLLRQLSFRKGRDVLHLVRLYCLSEVLVNIMRSIFKLNSK
jgi:hypothetical protein